MPRRRVLLLAFLLVLLLAHPALSIGTGFIENRGQVDWSVRYYTLGPGGGVYLTQGALVFDLKEAPPEHVRLSAKTPSDRLNPESASPTATRRGCAVYVRFANASSSPVIEPRHRLETESNYFLGNNRSEWRTGVAAYREIVYRDLWPGVNLVLREEEGKILYRFEAYPGTDVSTTGFRFEGAAQVAEQDGGSTLISTSTGGLIHAAAIPGIREGVFSPVHSVNAQRILPRKASDNPSALLWSTFLGGSEYDGCLALALDSDQNPVITGYTDSPDFPTTPGAYDEQLSDYEDAFVAKLNSSGSALLWSTFFGGSLRDLGFDVVLDPAGVVYVTGWTSSLDFPTTPGVYDTTLGDAPGSGADGFVVRISSSGGELLWSTYIGGGYPNGGADYCYGIALDQESNPIVAGNTYSSNFPTTPLAYDMTYNGGSDGFVSKLSASGEQLLWSTFLGSSESDEVYDLALDPVGNPVVGGGSTSPGFPTTAGCYDSTLGGWADAFLLKLSASGDSLHWSTFLGGSDSDGSLAFVMDPSGCPIITGWSRSSDFPTTPGCYDDGLGGSQDVFAAKLSDSGSALIWSTYLGGSGGESGKAVCIDPTGNVVLTGKTNSWDFPMTPDAYDTSLYSDCAFIARLDSWGSSLLWSSFLGGVGEDDGTSIVLDNLGNAVVAGWTWAYGASEFPSTSGAYDESWNGMTDGFVVKMSLASLTEVDNPGDRAPLRGTIRGNRPNPFNPVTEIRYDLPIRGKVSLGVFDVSGRLIRTMLSGDSKEPGRYVMTWDGRDNRGHPVPSGIYFALLQAGDFTATRKMVLLR